MDSFSVIHLFLQQCSRNILYIISVFVGDELYINKYSKTYKCYTIHHLYLKSIHRDEGLWLPELV